ncbi:MAG TPA: hypothetical protein P5110_02760 [Candidatus Omnitrophota bacterium]|nr:hypothetical protein [Candidatus Omnitrophota bacterium]HRZ14409.1 hypothetical protein [Candidatus Omnitrophota bacterium]
MKIFNLFFIIVCVVFCGCATTLCPQGELEALRLKTLEQQQLIAQQETELRGARAALQEKESAIQSREQKIEKLRKQLESLGVFAGG